MGIELDMQLASWSEENKQLKNENQHLQIRVSALEKMLRKLLSKTNCNVEELLVHLHLDDDTIKGLGKWLKK